MKKQLITLTVATLLSTSAMAAERSDAQKNNEIIGLGSGALTGAAVAGPIGGVIGGIVGLLIADDINDEQRLDATTAKLQARESQLVALNEELRAAQEKANVQLVSMDTQIEKVLQETESSIQFKTGSAELQAHYTAQLDLLARHLAEHNNMVLKLTGFADRRGDESFNQALSQQRVDAVKQYLLDKGVRGMQVLTYALGESQPVLAEQTLENDFFDRRVELRLEEGSHSMTASTQQ